MANRLIILLFLALVSCDKPACENKNAIFNRYLPNTKEYKDELVKQLAKTDKTKLTYWMDTYQEDSNSKVINAYIQGGGLCATIVLTISDSQKGIEGIIKSKGISYSGAELENLKFDIKQDSSSTAFVFREISGIID